MSTSIKNQLLNLGMKETEIDNHYSDLYVLKNDISTRFVNEYEYKQNVTTFKCQTDGLIWYEIPFAYYEEKSIKKALRDIKQETESQLKKSVITDILTDKDNEDIENYIKDILQHGCISAVVGDLIYYDDTLKFFKKHCEEILEMLEETKNDCGISFEINTNNLAWFGYEEITKQIASELEMDI